jgi:formate hydrogenlyase subunit 3/multisubunit Na+/H+ antiporter MnhD subunit
MTTIPPELLSCLIPLIMGLIILFLGIIEPRLKLPKLDHNRLPTICCLLGLLSLLMVVLLPFHLSPEPTTIVWPLVEFELLTTGLNVVPALFAAFIGAVGLSTSLEDKGAIGLRLRRQGLFLLITASTITLFLVNNWLAFIVAWELGVLFTFSLDRTGGEREEKQGQIPLFVHRFGSIPLILAVMSIWAGTGSLSISKAWITGLEGSYQIIAAVGFLVAALVRAAQFPFHSWFTGMGREPQTVLSYQTLVVIPGPYLLILASPLVNHLHWWNPTLVVLGLISLILGSLLALFEERLADLLALLTTSQLGLSLVAVGSDLLGMAILMLGSYALGITLLLLASRILDAGQVLEPVTVGARARAAGPASILGFASISGLIPTAGAFPILTISSQAFVTYWWAGPLVIIGWLLTVLASSRAVVLLYPELATALASPKGVGEGGGTVQRLLRWLVGSALIGAGFWLDLVAEAVRVHPEGIGATELEVMGGWEFWETWSNWLIEREPGYAILALVALLILGFFLHLTFLATGDWPRRLNELPAVFPFFLRIIKRPHEFDLGITRRLTAHLEPVEVEEPEEVERHLLQVVFGLLILFLLILTGGGA